MPFINGQWIDEEQARMMAMRGVNPMIYGGTFDAPMIYGGTTDVPDPMIYGGTTDVPSSMAFQGEGMLSPTLPNPLQAFTEPAFTQPLAALNRHAVGLFQGEGDTMDPAAINAAMGPQLAGPTVNQFRPTGSDYTPQQLSTPVEQLQQQNIPSNVVPIDPTAGLAASDPNLQGVTPFSQASVASRLQAPGGPSMSPIQAAMAPQTSALTPFASQAFVAPDSPQDYINEGTVPPGISLDNQSNIFLDTQYKDPPTIGGYDKGPDAGWGLTNVGGIYGTEPVVGGDNGVTPGYNPGLDASIINESMQSQAMSSADINAMMSKASGRESDPGAEEGFFGDFGSIAGIDIPGTGTNLGNILLNLDPDKIDGYLDKQNIIERLVTLGLLTSDQADQAKQYSWQTDSDTNWVQRLYQIGGTALTAPILQMIDEGSIPAGLRAAFNNQKGIFAMPGSDADPLIVAMAKGEIKPSELQALVSLDPGTVDKQDVMDIVTKTDSFHDIDKIAAQTAARQAQLDADKAAAQAQRDAARAEQQAAAAASRASTQMANRKANQRIAMLAKKAKAKSKLAAQKAAAAQAAAAVQAQAAAQAQAQSEANAAIERVAQARALMGSRAFMESGMGGLSPAERDIVAAANVDTFAGISGMGMGFMGSNIGQEDGGGYTGGDFSSGQGWE